jgi:hypothetical protein
LIALLLLTFAIPAVAQRSSLQYEGPIQMGRSLRYVRLYLTRDRLTEWKGREKKVVGWRYQGTCVDTNVRNGVRAVDYAVVEDDVAADSTMQSPVAVVDDDVVVDTNTHRQEATADASSEQFFYKVSGASTGPGLSDADSSRVSLIFSGDSLGGSVEGEFTSDGRFIGNWKSFDGDGGLIPFVLRRKSIFSDPEDEAFYATDFPPFWDAFREALRRRDAGTIAGMVQFPLRGPKCLAHASRLPDNDNSRVNRQDFVSRFDHVFDSVTTAELVRTEPYAVETELLYDSIYGPRSEVREGSLVYTVTIYPTSGEGYSRTFRFGRIKGGYRLMGVECNSTEGC